MKLDKKLLEQKTEEELIGLAKELGLEGDFSVLSKKELVSKILSAKPVEPAVKKYRLVIHSQDGPENTPNVAVGINGYHYLIPRDVEVEVPEEVIEVLKNSLVPVYVPGSDAQGDKVVKKLVPRFPFSVLGEAKSITPD